MKKLFVIASTVAVAFLTGCASNGYVQQPNYPQMVQQPQVAAQAAPAKTLASLESQGKGNEVRCHLVFSDQSTVDLYGGTCAEKADEIKAFQTPQKVTYVTAPAQQAAGAQYVAAPASSFWDSPVVRGVTGAIAGAFTGWGVNKIAGGDSKSQKVSVFGGAIAGGVIGVASAPSSGGGQQVVAPGYGGGYPQMMPQQYYGGYTYASPDRAYLEYQAVQSQYVTQTRTFNFNNCGALYGYYSPLCQR